MGLFGWLSNSANIINATSCGNKMVYSKLDPLMLDIIRNDYWTSSGHLLTLENDNGFFNYLLDIFFTNSNYSALRRDDPDSYIKGTLCTAALGGVYVNFCAKIIQKPLYANFKEVTRRFQEVGPANCIANFTVRSNRNVQDVCSTIDTLAYLSNSWNNRKFCSDNSIVEAIAHVAYDTGITMGQYYL